MTVESRSGQDQFPELIDIETVAKLLGVGERYVRRMVAERRVPTVKIGHYVRFDLADIRDWVEEQRRPNAS
ncbi:MAG: helix-turn-helix domain-containing protein [Vulcanimicrobiaceae bacterium]